MYVPTHFAADDATVLDLLSRPQSSDLVTMTADGLVATFLPFLFDAEAGGHGVLRGHLARTSDQWRRPVVGEALVIVRGPDAHVSPGWYASRPPADVEGVVGGLEARGDTATADAVRAANPALSRP